MNLAVFDLSEGKMETGVMLDNISQKANMSVICIAANQFLSDLAAWNDSANFYPYVQFQLKNMQLISYADICSMHIATFSLDLKHTIKYSMCIILSNKY